MGKIDSTFKSLHFENIALPDDYEGMPAEICRNLRNQIDEIEKEIENVQKQMKDFLSVKAKKIRGARYKLEELSNNFDVRKMAACMENEEQEDYYILCGWMSEKIHRHLLRRQKMMIESRSLLKKEEKNSSVIHQRNYRIPNSSNHLKCLSECMDCHPMMRWIQPFSWH